MEILTGFRLKEDAANRAVSKLSQWVTEEDQVSPQALQHWGQVVPMSLRAQVKEQMCPTCIVSPPVQRVEEESTRVLKPCKLESCGIAMFSLQRKGTYMKIKAETQKSSPDPVSGLVSAGQWKLCLLQ